ncbi:hypothetical protein [Fibrobacter sp.]|uniref:hypothetical protein n=1 Tax=Fibrobacter sp. TaxID=35828 RepID=UPI0026160618|nr:hypothetical protein [Fibrobacter sp.]MDD7498674.1 hypothetical protein [Fibrobacter sp.]MDY5724968.1 hypothetical protein [Fibrobacter sp.]
MKIEKKIVKNSAKLSIAAKSAIAASFGIAAVALTACEESATAASPAQNPETGAPENETPSSSSVVDIPLSHEALSSSAVEALSSAAEPLSSSSFEEPYPPPEAGTIAAPTDEDIYGPSSSSSSEEEAQSSSAEEPVPLAGDPIVEESSSSEVEQPSSSSVDIHEVCPDNDPFCIQVHMCNNEDGCMVASMVSTYERFDTAG